MRHAILGAGAIGGLIGAVLSKLGENVTVVVHPDKLLAHPANLSLERPSGFADRTELGPIARAS
jgi:ketopantoate reductase